MIKALIGTLVFFFLLSPVQAQMTQGGKGLVIGSWNTNKLGHGKTRNWKRTAKILSSFDFIALQEVMSSKALIALIGYLKKETKTDWSYIMTDQPVGGHNDKEYLAFIWKTNKVVYENTKNTFHNTDKRFSKAPFAARFSSIDKTHRWTAMNVHTIESKNKELVRKEVTYLDDYFIWAQDYISDGTPMLLMGEFDLPNSDIAYKELNILASPLLRTGSTGIDVNRKKIYDLKNNIWEEASGRLDVKSAEIENFKRRFEFDNKESIQQISDRLPVKIILGTKKYAVSNYIRPKRYKEFIRKLHILCVKPSNNEGSNKYSNEFIMLKNEDPLFDFNLNGWTLENEEGKKIYLGGNIAKRRTNKIYTAKTDDNILKSNDGLIILRDPVDNEYARIGYKNNKGICNI